MLDLRRSGQDHEGPKKGKDVQDASQNRTSIIGLIKRFSRADHVAEDMRVFGEGLDMESVAYAEFICEIEEDWDVELELEALGPVDQTVGQLTDRILTQIDAQS